MRRILLLRLFIALGLVFFVQSFCLKNAHAQVTIILNTPPQLPERVNDWERLNALFSVTVTNTGGTPLQRLRIAATVTNLDNNATLFRTKNDLTRPFNAPPRVPQTLTAPQILPANSFEYDASVQTALIRTNTLPEGAYRLCVRVIDERGATLGFEQCRTFNVIIPDPPSLISPANGDSVRRAAPSVPVLPQFQWTPVFARFGQQSKYKLRVVPVFEGQQPRQALEANPTLFEKIIPTSSYQWLPSDAQFGNYPNAKGFVWQVQAIDPSDVSIANVRAVGRNEGKSEMFTFGIPQGASNNSGILGNKNNPKSGNKGLSPGKLDAIIPKTTTVSGNVRYFFSEDGWQNNTSLANTPVLLVEYYSFENAKGNYEASMAEIQSALMKKGFESFKVLASGVTNADGKFTLSFVQTDSTGIMIQKGYSLNAKQDLKAVDFSGGLVGNLRRVLRLIVANEYMLSPDDNIIVQPGEVKNFSKPFLSQVRSWQLTVRLLNKGTEDVTKGNYVRDELSVLAVRNAIPSGVPKNEGDNKGSTIVVQKNLQNEGLAVIDRLVKNISLNDRYNIMAYMGKKAIENLTFDIVQFDPTKQQKGESTSESDIYLSDDAVFNSEYKYPTRKLDLWGTPQMPRIYGTVLHAETGELLEGVNVLVQNITKTGIGCGWNSPRQGKTNAQGEFSLDNLVENCPWKITVSKPGYIQQQFWVNSGEVLNKGEQANAGGGTNGIRLTPQLQVFGRVVDSKGNGVDAIVQIGNSKAKQTLSTSKAEDKGKFMCRVVPSNKPQTVVATPLVEADNYEKTFEIVIDGKEDAVNNPLLSPIKLQSRMFQLRVSVGTEEGPQLFKPKPGMTVQAISGENILASAVSDNLGIAMLEWKNMVEEGTFRVVAAPSKNENWSYTPVTVELSQQMPKGVTLKLKPGAEVSGLVVLKLGSKEEPVKNARVSLAASGANLPTTYTDENGAFTLRNLPKAKNLTLQASFGSAPSKTMAEIASEGLEKLDDKTKNVSLAKNKDDKPTESYVGAETVVSTGNGNVSGVKMTLTSYNNMDLSKLLGFDIVLSDVKEENGKTFISGSLDMKQLATKSGFAEPKETAVLSFTNIEIKPGSTKNTKGVPIADIVTNEIPLDKNSIELSSKGKAIALALEDISLKKDASGIGVIAGKVRINLSASLKFTNGKLDLQDNALYLAHPKPQQGQSASVIPVFYGAKEGAEQSLAAASNGFAITDNKGQKLKYSLYDFQAENTPMQSFARLDKDSLFLYTTITLSITNLKPEKVSVSFGVPITANANGIEEIKGSSPLTLQMDKWELVATSWSLTKSGFALDKGSLKTGIVDAPFKDIKVLPEGGKSKLFIPNGAFTLKEMTLGGVIPISFTKSPTLTYNDKQPWRFEAIGSSMSSPAATITKPTGFSENIKLGAITLVSNDDKVEIGVLEQPLTLYNQFDFKPLSILIGKGITFKGHLDLRVPDFAAVNANVNVAKWGDAPVLDNFNVKFKTTTSPMTIELDAKSMTIGTEGFFASGKAFEDGVRSFPIQFARTEKVIEARLPKGYEFFLDENGSSQNAPKLTNVEGAMIVPTASKNGKWETMRFGGDLTNAGGASGKLYFAMKNALTADDLLPSKTSKIGVENMPSDFGGITLVYNPNKHRLEGGVHVENEAAGGKVKGDIQIIVDAGGWYFAGSGELTIPSPSINGYALLVFGNHAINSELSGLMAQYSSYLKTYGRPPLGMPTQNVKGFYFEGGFAMPIPNIPELGFDFGLVAAELKHQIGGSVRLGMDFSKKTQLTMGLSLMAGLHLGLDASLLLVCAEVDASVNADISFDGMFKSTTDWRVQAAAQATLAGMTTFGVGTCPSCDFLGCVVKKLAASVTLGAQGYYQAGGNSDLSFYLK
ncbi:MAG: carboxypeptidase regulatory-like domain-containing protein [Candidatus Kapaibacteriota bacterium]